MTYRWQPDTLYKLRAPRPAGSATTRPLKKHDPQTPESAAPSPAASTWLGPGFS